ncbi:MAG: class I SAM-dependent methyltransferase [Octadecabacter sp.]
MKQTSDISFASDWLALREPADHAARDAALLGMAARCALSGAAVLDLGCGTGSTARAFAGAGFDHLDWRLFDSDAGLLSLAANRDPNVDVIVGDLGDVADIPLDGVGLVTASALLDLMSLNWLEALAKRVCAANLPFYGALNYNGVMDWSPPRPDDKIVTDLFNSHQQRDKGTGPALGPTSGETAGRIFKDLGYDVYLAQSPWVIAPDQPDLHTMFLDGVADAVADMDDALAQDWRAYRNAAVSKTRATVGHLDILALPATRINT